MKNTKNEKSKAGERMLPKPTGGHQFYFAYGSNMNPSRIAQRIPQARAVGVARIKGWKLVERLYADIERCEGAEVDGVLYLLNREEILQLDLCEGYPKVYDCIGVDAYLDAKHKVYAFTYTMTEATKRRREGKPYPPDYRLLCSRGAFWHGVKDAFRRRRDPPPRFAY